jgi:peptidoglycan hydrolase-like protein with peptidoglycan-binding domain
MSAPTSTAPRHAAPSNRADALAARRRRRTLAIGGVAAAIAVGVAFGQVTGSMSDDATGARDPAASTSAPPGGDGAGASSTTTAAPTRGATTTTSTPRRSGANRVPPSGSAAVTDERLADAAAAHALQPGRRGTVVRALQERLAELGYWPGESRGVYTDLTRQAVLAFQKAEGMDARDGVADGIVAEELASASPIRARSQGGTVVEVDRRRQLVLIVEDGVVRWTFNAATGDRLGQGRYTIDRHIDGHYNAPLGAIHRPSYFHGRVALQGTGRYPAPPDQGCACVSDAAMDLLWSEGAAEVGTTVLVY